MAGTCLSGCFFLDSRHELRLKVNIGSVCSWVRSLIFPKACAEKAIDTLNKNIFKSEFVVDACEFAGFFL